MAADHLTVEPLCPKCGGTCYVGAQMCQCLREASPAGAEEGAGCTVRH
ncbi:MAG: hypothetical protein V8S85_08050 [Oscillospiraceae bacterium]